jgi:hypothetical protein
MTKRRSLNNLFIEGSFGYGCIEVQDLADLSLNTANFLSAPNKLNILLISYLDEPWKGDSHIAIHMFHLPEGQEEFDRIQAWFGDERKSRARLPDGVPFEESVLAIRNLPPDWKHTAYPRSCRDFIHIYTSAKQAILLRVKSKRGTVLNHPLLSIAAEKIRIVPFQWETRRPKIRLRQTDAGTESFVISEADFSEILAYAKQAKNELGINEVALGAHCVERIHDYIEWLRSGANKTKRDVARLAPELGCLWGTALLETGEWEWRMARFAGEEFLAVFNNAETHAVAPIVLINNLLKSKKSNNNILLLYNMIREGNLPDTIGGQVVWLT